MFQSTDACCKKRQESGRGGGERASRGRQGRGGQGWSPDPTPEARRGAQVGPRRPRRRVPARPSALGGILYNSPSPIQTEAGCALPGPPGRGARAPSPRGSPRSSHETGGKARAPALRVPLAKALDRGRSPSGSRERHQLRQLLQTPCPVSLQPGSRHRGARAAGRAGRRVSGEEKVPGDPPVARSAQPPRPHPCPGVGNLGPPAARGPRSPLSSQGSRGGI